MEDAQRIFEYLPISFKNPTERDYINFLLDAFKINYEAEKYPFALVGFNKYIELKIGTAIIICLPIKGCCLRF